MARNTAPEQATDESVEAVEQPAAQPAKEFRATAPLFIGRARAANPGDVVPAANVEKYDWADKVEPV